MIETLNTTYPDNQFVQQEVSNVNPTIGNEFLAKSVVAVVAACVLILVYVAVRFRRIGGWSAGAMAIVALLHDMFVVYGVFVLLRIPLNGNLLQAMLTFWLLHQRYCCGLRPYPREPHPDGQKGIL